MDLVASENKKCFCICIKFFPGVVLYSLLNFCLIDCQLFFGTVPLVTALKFEHPSVSPAKQIKDIVLGLHNKSLIWEWNFKDVENVLQDLM